MRMRIAAVALFGLLGSAAPVLAHHAFTAEFDDKKLVAFKGTLTRVEWQNPHVWFYMDVKDENGNVSNWAFETVSPNHIHHQYETARQDFDSNIGKEMTVVACPAKFIPHRGSAQAVRFLESGKVMKVGLGGAYSGTENEDDLLQNVK